MDADIWYITVKMQLQLHDKRAFEPLQKVAIFKWALSLSFDLFIRFIVLTRFVTKIIQINGTSFNKTYHLVILNNQADYVVEI